MLSFGSVASVADGVPHGQAHSVRRLLQLIVQVCELRPAQCIQTSCFALVSVYLLLHLSDLYGFHSEVLVGFEQESVVLRTG